jgi:hypothetical protein
MPALNLHRLGQGTQLADLMKIGRQSQCSVTGEGKTKREGLFYQAQKDP